MLRVFAGGAVFEATGFAAGTVVGPLGSRRGARRHQAMSVRQSGRAMRSREARAPIGLVAPMPGHLDCELDAGGDVQLGEDMGEMGLHCPRGHIRR